jgi:hypothetical protein
MTSKTLAAMQQHVKTLTEGQDITVRWIQRPGRGQSAREWRETFVAPVKSPISYIVALHEIGHLLGRHQGSSRVMVRERWAWKWARQNALIWAPAFDRYVSESLDWYASRARSIDAKWRPAEYGPVTS